MPNQILKKFCGDRPEGWTTEKIGDCLREVSVPIRMRDSESYRLVSIRRRNGGMFERGHVFGRDILTKTLQKVIPGSFVIARMQVVHGACSLASEEFSGAAISKSYTSFAGTDRCGTKFFSWLAKSPLMYAYYLHASHGVVIEKMTFDQESWLRFPIYLPPWREQLGIVEVLEAADESILSKRQLVTKLDRTHLALTSHVMAETTGWRLAKLAELLQGRPKNGYSPKEVEDFTGVAMLGLGCLTPTGFEPRQIKNSPPRDPRVGRARLADGDLLVSRANTREYVGLAGRYRDIGMPCIYPDLMMRLTAGPGVRTDFLELALRSPFARKQIEALAVGTSESMVKISSDIVMNLEIKLPALEEQERIVRLVADAARPLQDTHNQVRKLIAAKQGLMKDLLTGQVRVNSAGKV
ncbi:hypothetical protein [Micromonospora sp. LOL_015]|uniref:hypothetical protein n=1 Tax=Micromonospora sp. LOL_015 TaxID=3345416 RepID=UPI003A8AEEA3